MPQRGPHRKMFLFIYVYIYIYIYMTYGRAILFFLFFQPSWNGVGLQSTFLKCFKSTTRGKRSRWWGCGLIMCTGVYWWSVLMCIDMCIDGSNDCESDSIKEAMHIGLVLLCPCAQTDRPTDRSTEKNTQIHRRLLQNQQKYAKNVIGC